VRRFQVVAEKGRGFARVGAVEALVCAHDGAGAGVDGVVEGPRVELAEGAVGDV